MTVITLILNACIAVGKIAEALKAEKNTHKEVRTESILLVCNGIIVVITTTTYG